MKTSEEKVTPFRLVKFFTFSSLIVIFICTIVLSVLNTDWIRDIQQKRSEEAALFVAEKLNHNIFWQFFVPTAIKYKKIKLRDKVQANILDKVIHNALKGYNVDMVTIYDIKKNKISYSFDKNLVGMEDVGGPEYFAAVTGKTSTKLIQKGNFIENFLGFPSENKMITTAPLLYEQVDPEKKTPSKYIGVVEIVQDLSEDFRTIYRFQIVIIATITIVMCLLFIILYFVVRKGEAIINKRTEERMKLEEQLSRSKHLSSIGEMVAGISHEIRNPLGIIRSSGELLKKKMASLDSSSTIPDIIVEEAVRLDNIITDFLDFAKPRQPNPAPCRVEDIIQKNLTFLAPQFEEKGCVVEKQKASFIPEITADANMLYQAFLNILINGMQAMPGGGKLFVGITPNDGGINIVFEDEGPGITEEILKKVWDPFFSTKDKGTGLGLGIVKKIIEAHAGTVKIENKKPRGARLTVKIPARQGN